MLNDLRMYTMHHTTGGTCAPALRVCRSAAAVWCCHSSGCFLLINCCTSGFASSSSTLAATIKSFSDRPLRSCVHSSIVMLFQPCVRTTAAASKQQHIWEVAHPAHLLTRAALWLWTREWTQRAAVASPPNAGLGGAPPPLPRRPLCEAGRVPAAGRHRTQAHMVMHAV